MLHEERFLGCGRGCKARHLRREKNDRVLNFFLGFLRTDDGEYPCLIRDEMPKLEQRLTLHANRGNAKDCFVPFGTSTSPRSTRTPGSPAPKFASSPDLPSADASCVQNTPFITLDTKVLLLRLRPASSAASEPIATVRSRYKRGELTSRSSACASVPRSVRSRGTGELLAYVD